MRIELNFSFGILKSLFVPCVVWLKDDDGMASWELRVEGRLLDEVVENMLSSLQT